MLCRHINRFSYGAANVLICALCLAMLRVILPMVQSMCLCVVVFCNVQTDIIDILQLSHHVNRQMVSAFSAAALGVAGSLLLSQVLWV